jgi:hypothetical protein
VGRGVPPLSPQNVMESRLIFTLTFRITDGETAYRLHREVDWPAVPRTGESVDAEVSPAYDELRVEGVAWSAHGACTVNLGAVRKKDEVDDAIREEGSAAVMAEWARRINGWESHLLPPGLA